MNIPLTQSAKGPDWLAARITRNRRNARSRPGKDRRRDMIRPNPE